MAFILSFSVGCTGDPAKQLGTQIDARVVDSDDASTPLDAGTDASPPDDAGSKKPHPKPDAAIPLAELDQKLLVAIEGNGLTGDPSTKSGLKQIRPKDNPLVRLGQVLFFSQTMAGGFDATCGTCHHPDFAGSDGLSISVGTFPMQRSVVGPGRRIDPTRDLDPLADGGPNMPRNSLTTFNIGLFDRQLMRDGRVFVLDPKTKSGGRGQAIRTPESGLVTDSTEASGLLEIVTKFPMMPDNEMRGFLHSDITLPSEYRERILDRLRGTADQEYLDPQAPAKWLELFRAGFKKPTGTASELITMLNVQRALTAYIQSQIFVDTPWRRYVQGDYDALGDDAKRGALLFLTPLADGGLGCSGCHSGDQFSNEGFANVGFPQLGRGFKRSDRRDVGRWLIDRETQYWYTFRVAPLSNVALTAPYGHAGEFASLPELLRYHANPRAEVDHYDFSLQHLSQYAGTSVVYPNAEAYTREAIAYETFTSAEMDLPHRSLTTTEVSRLVAFLDALTDSCAADPGCRSDWTPDASLDPDGHMLVRGSPTPAPIVSAPRPTDYPTSIDLAGRPIAARTTFADVQSCSNGLTSAVNANAHHFTDHTGDSAFGLTAPHGFDASTWLPPNRSNSALESTMIAGGVTAAYLDDDCWPDLAFAGGDASGIVLYRNLGAQAGFATDTTMLDANLRAELGTQYTGVAVADLDGNYRRELLLGNLHPHAVPVLSQTDDGKLYEMGAVPMQRNTYGISFGFLDYATYPDIYFAHWSFEGTPGSAPAFFRNDGVTLMPYDKPAKTSSAYIDQSFNFTPKFLDANGDGRQDILAASDFKTSAVLQNSGGTSFDNVTDRSVITDENGMGSALGDFDNDGKIDWFVTAILDPMKPKGNWGPSGNRLYRNVSGPSTVDFEDVTEQAGVRDGYWGWGACAADFDQDGFLDIFHVNGFGYIPDNLFPDDALDMRQHYLDLTDYFRGQPSRLFINKGDGTFKESATAWGIDRPSEGRGIACFDYDRDGDIDIALVDQSTGLQFFENQTGHGAGSRFLSVRVVGAAPNTEALGARVTVIADVGNGHGWQNQVRVAEANSNFESQNLPDLHFGLGSASVVGSVKVEWPNDPTPVLCLDVAVNQFVVFDQRNKGCP